MADVHVTTYAELRAAVNNATEATDIYLDSDIDLNEESPTGVSGIAVSSGVRINVYGKQGNDEQNHKIKNILYNSNNPLLKGYSDSYWLYFFNVDFENVQIQALGSSCQFLGNYTYLYECKVSITLYANSNAVTQNLFTAANVTVRKTAITVTGANSTKKPFFGTSESYYWDFNNIKLLGTFGKLSLYDLRNCYIGGDFKETDTASSNFKFKLIVCILNATIEMAVLPTCTGSSLALINTDDLTLPSGKTLDDLSSLLTKCTTAEMESTSALWDTYGFPIR